MTSQKDRTPVTGSDAREILLARVWDIVEGEWGIAAADAAREEFQPLVTAVERAATPDADRLALAWGSVMGGRRIGRERIEHDTTTRDDWRAIVEEYAAIARDDAEPES